MQSKPVMSGGQVTLGKRPHSLSSSSPSGDYRDRMLSISRFRHLQEAPDVAMPGSRTQDLTREEPALPHRQSDPSSPLGRSTRQPASSPSAIPCTPNTSRSGTFYDFHSRPRLSNYKDTLCTASSICPSPGHPIPPEGLRAHFHKVNTAALLVVVDHDHLIWYTAPEPSLPIHAPKARCLPSQKDSHAARLHDLCIAAEEKGVQATPQVMDHENHRLLWKTGNPHDVGFYGAIDKRPDHLDNSPLNPGAIYLRHPDMSDAAQSMGESAAHDESDFLGNEIDSLGDEDLDLEGQEYEAEEYEGEEGEEGEEEEDEEDDGMAFDPHPPGLKEISNLGKFTVSTHKQDNGVEELRSDDLGKFWQSDGTQPHNLTVYFIKKVAIREIRFYVDYDQDESYTPTRIIFRSGTGENNMLRFASMDLVSPKGWQKVPLAGVGGGPDGDTLFCWVLQVAVMENHQNGKDTHLRGIKIFAVDVEDGAAAGGRGPAAADAGFEGGGETTTAGPGVGGGADARGWPDLSLAGEFLREPELR